MMTPTADTRAPTSGHDPTPPGSIRTMPDTARTLIAALAIIAVAALLAAVALEAGVTFATIADHQ